MKKTVLIMTGLGIFCLLGAYSSTRAEEGVREVVLTSRVEQGAKIWSPPKIFAKTGEKIKIRLENHTEVMHGFQIEELGIREHVMGGQEHEFIIQPSKKGVFLYFCFIHKAHKGGELVVE